MALLFGLAPGGVCLADAVTRAAGELLPHRFTLTVSLRRSVLCGTVPWGRPPWPLASTLPCGARTFLPPRCRDRRSPSLLWRASSIRLSRDFADDVAVAAPLRGGAVDVDAADPARRWLPGPVTVQGGAAAGGQPHVPVAVGCERAAFDGDER